MSFCACGGSIRGTGKPSKQNIINGGVILIAVPVKADDGTFNEILASDTIDESFVQGKINEADPSKRWYPVGTFRNEEDTRADPVTESFNDGSSVVTQQGVRTFVGWLVNFSPVYLKALGSLRCQTFGVFMVDPCGNIIGKITQSGNALRPVKVNNGSWEPRYVKGTPTVSAKIQLSFEFDQTENDKNLRLIPATEIGINMLDVEGLLPLKVENVTDTSATTLTFDLLVDYDQFLNGTKEPVVAWELADFSIRNKTTNSVVTITSVTESPEGTYVFVISPQTLGDVVEVTNNKTAKPGFDLRTDIVLTS